MWLGLIFWRTGGICGGEIAWMFIEYLYSDVAAIRPQVVSLLGGNLNIWWFNWHTCLITQLFTVFLA